MSVIVQHATATADASGAAHFMFPDVPVGELWSGTTSIPQAEPSVVSVVTSGGQLLGSMIGPGIYGPWLSDHSKRLAISSTGATPGRQYIAVWHADNRAAEWSTYPAPLSSTAAVASIPEPVNVEVANASLEVVTTPHLVSPTGAGSGELIFTSAGVLNIPGTPAATLGVIVSADEKNNDPLQLFQLYIAPGVMTPLLPITNAPGGLPVGGQAGDQGSYLIL